MQAHRETGCAGLNIGFAGRLTPEAQTRLLTLGRPGRFQRGECLLHEGERSDHVVLLIRGRVKVVSTAENGYALVLGIRGPGDLVGELAGLDGSPRSATVTALDPVLGRVIPGPDFRRFIRDRQDAGMALMELIAYRLRYANRWRLEVAAFPVQRRLALVLLDLERWYGVSRAEDPTQRDIDLKLSQLDLAGLVGSSLESAAKAIRGFAIQGIVQTRRYRVTILDRTALAEVADE